MGDMRKLFSLLIALALSLAPAYPAVAAKAKMYQAKRVRHSGKARHKATHRVVRRHPALAAGRSKTVKPGARRAIRNRKDVYSKSKPRNVA